MLSSIVVHDSPASKHLLNRAGELDILYTALPYTTLWYSTICCSTSYCITLYCFKLRYVVLYYTIILCTEQPPYFYAFLATTAAAPPGPAANGRPARLRLWQRQLAGLPSRLSSLVLEGLQIGGCGFKHTGSRTLPGLFHGELFL